MPYIKKFPKRNRSNNSRKRNKSDKEKLRVKLYNNKKWKRLRLAYIMEHPLCERCLSKGIINGNNIQCHHIISPFEDGLSEEERLERLLSFDNLESLCPKCHGDEHRKKQIEDEESNNIHLHT